MKSLWVALVSMSIAFGGAGLMGCHASADVEPTSSTDNTSDGHHVKEYKKTTTVNNDTGAKTTKTEETNK